jgi:hypothetical protein
VTEVWGARPPRSLKEWRSKPLSTPCVAGGDVNSSMVVPPGHHLTPSTQSRCGAIRLQVRLSVDERLDPHTPLTHLSTDHIPHHFPAYLDPHSTRTRTLPSPTACVSLPAAVAELYLNCFFESDDDQELHPRLLVELPLTAPCGALSACLSRTGSRGAHVGPGGSGSDVLDLSALQVAPSPVGSSRGLEAWGPLSRSHELSVQHLTSLWEHDRKPLILLAPGFGESTQCDSGATIQLC